MREQRHRRGNTLIATTWLGPRWRSSHTLLKPDSDSSQADGDLVPSLAWSDSSALWLKAGTTFTRASRTGDFPAVQAWVILLPLLHQSSHQSSQHTAADGSCWQSPSLSGPVLHRSASWPNRCGGTFCCTSAEADPRYPPLAWRGGLLFGIPWNNRALISESFVTQNWSACGISGAFIHEMISKLHIYGLEIGKDVGIKRVN